MIRFVALALLLALATSSESAPAAPGFKVRLIDGKTTLDSRDLIGKKILVLRFQASYVRKYKVTYPVALDPKLTIGNTFGFKGTPYTVVIDRRGEMVAQIHGASAVSRLPRVLDELLLKEEPPRS